MQTSLQALRRPLGLLAGTILVFLIAELAARVVLTSAPVAIRWYDEAAQLKLEQMDELDRIGVVFAGTSMAWQAFVPSVYDEATGTTSYNAGLNGGTPEVMERWLLEEVVQRLHPTTVVWGLSSLDLAPNYGDQQRGVYDNALATRTGLLADVEQAAAGWSDLIANRTVLRSANQVAGAGSDAREAALALADEQLGDDGERLDFEIDRSDGQGQIMQARLRDFSPSDEDLDTISRVVEDLRDRGIEVILVQLPVPSTFIAAHPNGRADYDRTTVAIDTLATVLDTRFLRLTGGVTDTDFVDFAHVDAPAATAFTTRAAEAIRSQRDDRGQAQNQPAPTTTNEPQPPPTDCISETIIDDYGLEIEIDTCPPGTSLAEGDTEMDRVFAALPEDDPLALAAAERDRLCEAGESPAPALRSFASAIDESADDLASQDDAQFGLAYRQAQHVALASGECDTPTGDPEIAAATASVAAALDRLFSLRGVPAGAASGLWRGRDQLLTAIWIREARANGIEVDGLVIGNSVSRTGIDPVLFGELTGTTVGQASIAGMSPETAGPFLDEIIDLVDPSTVYWGLSYFDLYIGCSVEARAKAAMQHQDLRRGAFAGIVDESSRRSWEHLLGAVGTDAYGETPILSTIDQQLVIDTLGQDDLRRTVADPDGLALQLELWPPDEPCLERSSHLAEHVHRLQAEGREVVIVVLPPNPELAGGADGLTSFFENAAVFAGPAESDRYVVLDDELAPEVFRDGVHFLDEGRAQLTAALAAALGGDEVRPG